MALTYDLIASTTLSVAGAITFSSIPGTYTDLVLRIQGSDVSGFGHFTGRFNSSSSLLYRYGGYNAKTSSTIAGVGTDANAIDYFYFSTQSNASTTESMAHVTIFDYSKSGVNKSYLSKYTQVGTTNNWFNGGLIGGNYNNTTFTITSIAIYGGVGGSLSVGTSATLHGVKRA